MGYLLEIEAIEELRPTTFLHYGSVTCPHQDVANTFVEKARICARTVIFTHELGFRLVQVERNSLSKIKKLNSYTVDRSVLSLIIQDIKDTSFRATVLDGGSTCNSGLDGDRRLAQMVVSYPTCNGPKFKVIGTVVSGPQIR
ncbi:hypothetical protein Godav_025881 [Gossypium davidsonii]|uniref:Uncharacterized protein n=1 Tax=Gossypium davidsonii TaxID=34287 RepID=A0A7J8TBG7_GOSDV|nr:hypothetical protein [Gossypium davidsonii]